MEWPTRSLGELCTIQSGGTPRRGPDGLYGGEIPWVKIGDMGVVESIVTKTEESITRAGLASIGNRLFPAGTVLLAMYGSVGKTAVAGRPLATNQAILGINPRPSAGLSTGFLLWWLRSQQPALLAAARGVTQANISKGIVEELRAPVPPMEEQHRIADILDKADAIRRKRQQALALTDDLLRATFLDMFGDPVTNPRGWPVSALGELATVQGGLQVTHARAANPLEVPYLRVANVYRERLSLDEIKVMRVTRAELDRIRLFAGDILVVEGHGDPMEIGRCAVWDGSWQDCIHQNHLIRVRARADLVFPSYLSAFLNSPGGARQLIGFGKTTTGLNTISASQVRQTKVLVPSVSRQRDYERFSASLARCRQSLTGSSEEAAALAAALTHRAFSGEL